MATKLQKCAARVNDEFADKLKAGFMAKFKRELASSYNIFAMRLVSEPADGEPFTQEQKDWVEAFDAGYCEAMQIVRALAP